MKSSTFLEFNNSIYGREDKRQWFQLPEKRMVSHSVRFGDHTFLLDNTTIQIMPLKDSVRVRAVRDRARALNLSSQSLSNFCKGLVGEHRKVGKAGSVDMPACLQTCFSKLRQRRDEWRGLSCYFRAWITTIHQLLRLFLGRLHKLLSLIRQELCCD